MRYGFNVFTLDPENREYRFYAKYSNTKEEACQEFYLKTLEIGETSLRINKIKPASQFEWEHFELHGDCFQGPNARWGRPAAQPKKKEKSRYAVNF